MLLLANISLGSFLKNSLYVYMENILSRKCILFDCVQYNKSWNFKREFLKDVLIFLKFNSGVFCF